jgi:oligoendopeptidase F
LLRFPRGDRNRDRAHILREQAEKRKAALDVDTLKPWDMDVDISGKPALKPFNSGAELVEKSIQCFSNINRYLGERLEIMKDNNLFDVESRKGKAPGGYNYPLSETGAPFIFMNSANTFRDLDYHGARRRPRGTYLFNCRPGTERF